MTSLGDIDTAVQELRLEAHHKAFAQKLAHIVTAIGTIPDDPPPGFTADSLIRLRELADETVDAVERRLVSAVDTEQEGQRLAGTVYEIRRRMEVVELWFRHRESA
jgi:hypothetical protein